MLWRRLIVASALVFSLVGAFWLAPKVGAADILKEACSAKAESPTCTSRSIDKNPLTGADGLLYKISVMISVVAGVVAVVMIMVSGFRYITSAGDAAKVTAAKSTLVGSVIGLIIIALAQGIITFVVVRIT